MPRRIIKQSAGPVMLSPLSLLEIRNALNMAIRRGEMGEAAFCLALVLVWARKGETGGT